ncbi:glycosyltransferase family 4 protein [Erysipelothrix sp. HDW6B]|uniref:glycosyltransferase n=1 Tax=Erysipelothrix sp. HDW6B TaxID=2714929 RepID=UPI00140B5AD9|nr:glycosyltransferase [Erysipelothrix sp. HDW6B]QIK86194.1 glycosyltransferase family 4 protein [Erysipelothrix sp. HDW6B]
MNNSRNIYITSLHMQHGGVEKVIASLANMFVEFDYNVEILCTYNLGPMAYPLNSAVKITYLTENAPNRDAFKAAVKSKNPFSILSEGLKAFKTLRLKKESMIQAIKSIESGTIISTRNEHSVLLSKYGHKNVHKIAQLHHDHNFDEGLIKDFKYHYQNIDDFLLLTPGLTEEVQEIMMPTNKHTHCSTMPNFIDVASPNQMAMKQKQVIAAGRLHADKGFDRLLDIWALFVEAHPDYQLKIYGDGPLRNDLIDKAAKLQITSTVSFPGNIDNTDLITEMGSSVAYALTSISEGFGLVLIEAMSQYTPVIAYDVRASPSAIITDGVDGYLIKENDAQSFADKLALLATDDTMRDTMSRNAQKTSQKYTKEYIQNSWLALIENHSVKKELR